MIAGLGEENKGKVGRRAVLATLTGSVFSGCQTSSALTPPGIGGGPMLGIDVLEDTGFSALAGKRVALITNQTSVNRRGTETRKVLARASQVNLVKLFTPEHGLDGRVRAGVKVQTEKDSVTGLTAFSLYGQYRKPTSWMLQGIDTLVFDLQDIGCRSYTYISTMVRAMEACAESNKEFVVLDRPNPLGGNRIEGPGLDPKWQSFVSEIPVPYVHGMTAGELALITNESGWTKRKARLGVVKMRNWTRSMTSPRLRLPWVATSPNIPNRDSPFYYVATGMLGGLANVDIGIGTNRPFEYAGAKEIDARALKAALERRGLPGVRFSEYSSSRKPGFVGVQMKIDERTTADLTYLDVVLMSELNRLTNGRPFATASSSQMNLFHKVAGTDRLARDIRRGIDPATIAAGWRSGVESFRRSRGRFLLYA